MSLSGYHARSLRIDATNRTFEVNEIDPCALQRFIGGSGLGTWQLLQTEAAKVDAYDEAAPIIIGFSPFIGTPLTTSARFALIHKSPLTERLNDSLCGSRFAITGKGCGVDSIAIVGRCEEPSVLIVESRAGETQARFEPAGEAWGMTTHAAENFFKKKYGANYSCLVIGPAGENLVRYATVSHDGRHAGRGGAGGVFGSKQIKAVLVYGTMRTGVHDQRGLVARSRQWSQRALGPATAKYRELGTVSNLLALNRLNALPSHNFQRGSFDQVDQIAFDDDALRDTSKKRGCAACNIGCDHYFKLSNETESASGGSTRIEYESLFALGPLCGVDNRDAILLAARRCDELGIDTISLGGTLSFVMECQARGLVGAEFPGFGQVPEIQDAIDSIASRRGVGDLLAEGSRVAAHRIGHDSIAFAPQIKGLEMPGYEPRAMQALALGMAVGSRGADHNRSGAYEVDLAQGPRHKPLSTETVAAAIESEDRAAIFDSLILCKFLRGTFTDCYAETAAALNELTDWSISPQDLQLAGKRIVNAKKQFNIQAGWNRTEDTLPKRFLDESAQSGSESALNRESFTKAIATYYELRGWSRDGRLSAEQIRDLEQPLAASTTPQREKRL